MKNLTPRKASTRNLFPSPDYDIVSSEVKPGAAGTITPQTNISGGGGAINPSSSFQQQQPASFITPISSTSSFNNNINNNNNDNNLLLLNNREGTTMFNNQLMNNDDVSTTNNNIHHQYSFKPSTTSSFLKPFMSFFFAHRRKNQSSSSSTSSSSNNKKDKSWPERIVFITGSTIFFTLSVLILVYALNFLFRQKSLPKSSSAKNVIYFLIGEVCTTLLLIVIRLFFRLENSDYDPSITKQLHKFSQHGVEVGVLFEYFTLEEREILFYLSNISSYIVGYATNSLCYAILFELIIVHAGSKFGFFKKDLLGLCVILSNIFCVFLGWFNVRVNDSLEVFLLSCSVTLMILMYSSNNNNSVLGSNKLQKQRSDSVVVSEEYVFILPKIFRLGHIITTHLDSVALAKHSYIEMFLVMAIGILGSIIGYRIYTIYTNATSNTQKRPRQVFLGRAMRNRSYPAAGQQFQQQQFQQQYQYQQPPGGQQQQQYIINQGYNNLSPQQTPQSVYGTPQQQQQQRNLYYQQQNNPYPPQFTFSPQQFAFSTTPTQDKMFYPQPPPNIRAYSTPQRY